VRRSPPPAGADVLAGLVRERGYAAAPGVLSAASCARLRRECERVLSALLSPARPDARLHGWNLPTGEAYAFKVKPIAGLSPAIAGLADHPLLRAILARLLRGAPRLVEDKLMLKQQLGDRGAQDGWPVLGPEVHRHIDGVYFARRGLSGDVVSSAFVLDDCCSASGPLRVWPGSHRRAMPLEDGGPHGPVVPDHAAPESEAVELVAPAGSLLLWHSRLVHASRVNRSGRPRRLVVFGHDHG
jgi:hypothetical protein